MTQFPLATLTPCPVNRTSRDPLPHALSRSLGLLVLFHQATAGCEYLAPPHQAWTEARVVGRVVEADSRQPVRGAKVTRIHAGEPTTGSFGDGDKGGPQMVDKPALAVSDRDGRFSLDAIKNAYLLMESFPDYVVTLRVQAQGYQTIQMLFTNVTYAGGDKKTTPIIETGDIPLPRNDGR